MKNIIRRLSSSQIIIFGFLFVIVIGTLLLMLPISSKTGQSVSFSTALFTATTSTCVTGLVVAPTVSWSLFGQAVILIMIQVGGLGVITVMAGFLIVLQQKIGLENRLIIQDAFNLNSLSGLVRFVKKVFIGTLIVEGVGALLYMIAFVPRFGARGIWISVFNSISAFCNAGMDIIGENSLCDYVSDPLVSLVTIALIVLGGLGYIVWWDLIRVSKARLTTKAKFWQSLTLHSKIAIVSTAVLLFGGALIFFAFEYNNSKTMADMSFWQRALAALFQSVTTRTAGFASLPQENLTTASSIVSIVLMFIGGSPVGTAGGIKTVTVAVLLLSTVSVIRGKNSVSVFNRQISRETVNKCSAIATISLSIALISTTLLSLTTSRSLIDVAYEIFSATATVGLSRNLTSSLSEIGRYIVIFTMFFGRIGPISMAVSLNIKKRNKNIIKDPTEEISVG